MISDREIAIANERARVLLEVMRKRGWKPDHVAAAAALHAAALISVEIGNTREQFLTACGALFDTWTEAVASHDKA